MSVGGRSWEVSKTSRETQSTLSICLELIVLTTAHTKSCSLPMTAVEEEIGRRELIGVDSHCSLKQKNRFCRIKKTSVSRILLSIRLHASFHLYQLKYIQVVFFQHATIDNLQYEQLQQLVQDQNELIRELRMEIQNLRDEVSHLRAIIGMSEHRPSNQIEPCAPHC